MKLIPLTQGKFAQVEDYEYLMQWKWYLWQSKDQATEYAVRQIYFPKTETKKRYQQTIRMHRQILGIINTKILIDHRDHNGLNNQGINIRVATRAQNNSNRTGYGSSNYLGVSKHTTSIKGKDYIGWQAAIAGKYIGFFDTEEQAAKKYDEYARTKYGSFANLNFP